MNHIVIAGHLGADPVSRFSSAGKKIVSLRVATRKRRKGKDETMWWSVVIFGDQFDNVLTHFKKGSPIVVAGEIDEVSVFKNKDNNPGASVNIIASSIHFSPFGRSEKSNESSSESSTPQAFAEVVYGKGPDVSFDDEVPF